MIGYAICASFCTHKKSLETLKSFADQGYDILPIMSENTYTLDTRFGKAEDLIKEVEDLCKKPIIHTCVDAEPIGPKIKLDALIISPCTGNTMAKIANGITDSAVTMAAKAHIRNERPLIIALATNDAMSGNFINLASLMNRKHVYFVPMAQDDPEKKPSSLICRFDLVGETLQNALHSKQIRPLFV